ncbi:MAG: hypothetical protein Q8N23_06475 [Archangium sp.]|nr:hypothetical protein [Archangium sp.]MDP3570694.1 hypothetical protein [Archangium sp.]
MQRGVGWRQANFIVTNREGLLMTLEVNNGRSRNLGTSAVTEQTHSQHRPGVHIRGWTRMKLIDETWCRVDENRIPYL